MADISIIAQRIFELTENRKQIEIEYGRFSKMVQRIDSFIGSLRLLRDQLTGNPLNTETFMKTIQSGEFLLFQCYYGERCAELHDMMLRLMVANQIETKTFANDTEKYKGSTTFR